MHQYTPVSIIADISRENHPEGHQELDGGRISFLGRRCVAERSSHIAVVETLGTASRTEEGTNLPIVIPSQEYVQEMPPKRVKFVKVSTEFSSVSLFVPL